MWTYSARRWALVATLLGVCACGPDLQDHLNNPTTHSYPEQAPSSLELLSYNVFLRPESISTRDHTRCRGNRIGEVLAVMDADIVALQESWQREAVTSLVDRSGEALPYRVLSKPRAAFFKNVSGGLSILSRWPIEDVRTLRFDTCHGEDCLATKGAIHAVIRVTGTSRINVVNTHLDAGDANGDRRARARQIEQLRDFVADIDRNTGPVVLLGDFNVDGIAAHEEFGDLLTQIRVNHDFDVGKSTLNCETNVSCGQSRIREQIDFVFTPTGESRLFRYDTRHLPLRTTACGPDVDYLSDHRAVSTTYDAFF